MTSSKPEDFAADFAALRDDVTKLTSSVSEFIRTQTAATSNTVFDAVDNARQKVSDTASKAQDRVAGASRDLETTIEHNPLAAVLIAMVAGVVYRHIWRLAKPQMNALISRLISDATAPVEQMSARLFKKAVLSFVAIGCLFVCSIFLTIALFIFVQPLVGTAIAALGTGSLYLGVAGICFVVASRDRAEPGHACRGGVRPNDRNEGKFFNPKACVCEQQ